MVNELQSAVEPAEEDAKAAAVGPAGLYEPAVTTTPAKAIAPRARRWRCDVVPRRAPGWDLNTVSSLSWSVAPVVASLSSLVTGAVSSGGRIYLRSS